MSPTEILTKIRLMDFDDLVIFTLLLEGCRSGDVSKILSLTPPAISHRLNKYIAIYGEEVFNKYQGRKVLSEMGVEIANKAKKTLCLFLQVGEDFSFTNFLLL